ncbi:MAG: hypothetical protein EOO90_18790 [Pedobacter sp.]|nr:MAG: hypothetical protein EOO90_18790 [Pedobacter sp.]
MKNLIYLVVVFLFSCGGSQDNSKISEQDTSVTPNIDTNEVAIEEVQSFRSIEDIKKGYASVVQKMDKGLLDSLSFKYNCDNERSGTVTYYSENSKVVSIAHRYAEYDHHSAVDQYFLQDDKLYFAFLNTTYWSFQSGAAAEGATKDDITEQRIYLIDNTAVECLEKKYTILSEASNNPVPATVPNKKIKCKPVKPLLDKFQMILNFKGKSDKSCLN